ncbi:hypothetical protein EJ07DRAFT_164734 [Lizonia empirigonia]|nr:hypothetical protein EJ07DRAFT_164734 [Lizonia empirigonia]
MPSLQAFISRNERAGSPQNGQPSINPQRQAAAANARVPMKPSIARPSTAQGLSVRDENVAQRQPAPLQQQHLERRPSGEGLKRDPYDTDASSLDSTTNHSVVQVENSPQVQQQQLDEQDVKLDGDGEVSGEDEYDDEGEFELDETWNEYFIQHNMADATYEERLLFLQANEPHVFESHCQPLPTIDGDSYPTTTDGHLTEGGERHEAPFEELGSPSPSPQRLPPQGHHLPHFSQQPLQQRPAFHPLHPTPGMPQNSKLFKKGEQIRGQQRVDVAMHDRGQSGQKHDAAYPPMSQLPTYRTANTEQNYAFPLLTQARQEIASEGGQVGLPQRTSRLPMGPGRILNPTSRITEPTAHPEHTSTTGTKTVLITQQKVDHSPTEVHPVVPVGDYDSDVLMQMDYEQLRHEDFDKNPRASKPNLPEDMLEKPLDERLQFVHKKFDSAAQSEFFNALPTNEWEDAGDWFLDRFSEIIKNTKAARQEKRKRAQEIEQKIEKRHKHVAKKQRLVEDAMAKMKAQGEELVPKSPRASKSPRPKRR